MAFDRETADQVTVDNIEDLHRLVPGSDFIRLERGITGEPPRMVAWCTLQEHSDPEDVSAGVLMQLSDLNSMKTPLTDLIASTMITDANRKQIDEFLSGLNHQN